MTAASFDEDALSDDVLRRVDELCLEFEAAFRDGDCPQLASYVAKVDAGARRAALFYLIRLEKDLLSAQGCEPSLGDYVQRFPGEGDVVELAWRDAPDFEVRLEVIIGPHRGRHFVFRRRDSFVVGRASCAHFRLPNSDPYFSRVHFLIEVNPPACRLVDLCSLNGTLVNGRKVEWADLRHGDLVQGGDTVIRVSIPYGNCRGASADANAQPTASRIPRVEPTLPRAADSPARAEATIRIPGYEINGQLGSGGMGIVYSATRQSDGAVVAIKTLRPAGLANDREVQRFLREAQILCDLRHPHIVSFQEFGSSDHLLYIVMDLVPGTDAMQLVADQGPLPIGRAVRIVCQALEALHHAHQRHYVHRDVKPANLLISGGDQSELCQVADFGLARVYYDSPMSGLTLMGNVGGTLNFMAPEQVTDFRNVGPPADQFSAAASLYYLCTGKHIYRKTPAKDNWQIANLLLAQPVPIQEQRTDIPPGLARIVNKALARNIDQRFPDVATLRNALSTYKRI